MMQILSLNHLNGYTIIEEIAISNSNTKGQAFMNPKSRIKLFT